MDSGLAMRMDPPTPSLSYSLVVLAFSLLQSLLWMEPLDPGVLSHPLLDHAEHLHHLSLVAQAHTLLLGTGGI